MEGTIKENLRFGNLEATDEEIVEAAKAANVDHFIRTLPGGYNMEMNQESSNISLGQKQLLTIARALLADPKILILDEATSSVDTRLELLIQKAMKNLMKGRTSFVIAHRLSTIQEADKILVLKDGQIIEQGNHQSLLADKGFYYELYNSQFSNKKSGISSCHQKRFEKAFSASFSYSLLLLHKRLTFLQQIDTEYSHNSSCLS